MSIIVLSVVWFTVTFWGVAAGMPVSNGACPSDDSVDMGELRWSAWPPGPRCFYTAEVDGFDGVRWPTFDLYIWLFIVFAGPIVIVIAQRRARARRRRGLEGADWSSSVVVIGLAWFIIAAIGTGYGLLVWDMGEMYCPIEQGLSTYGELSWSILPPGPVCTFTPDVHGFDEVRGPYPVMSIWLLVLVIGAVAFVVARRRGRAQRKALGN